MSVYEASSECAWSDAGAPLGVNKKPHSPRRRRTSLGTFTNIALTPTLIAKTQGVQPLVAETGPRSRELSYVLTPHAELKTVLYQSGLIT